MKCELQHFLTRWWKMSSVTSGGKRERVTISPDGNTFVELTQGQEDII